jgi:hypothetical protein
MLFEGLSQIRSLFICLLWQYLDKDRKKVVESQLFGGI